MSRLRASILILIFLALTGFALSRITLSVDVLALLPGDLPEVKGVRHFYEQFSRPNELIVTLEGEGAEGAAQSLAQALGERQELVSSVVWHLPLQDDAEAGADLLAYMWFNVQPSHTQKLIDDLGEGKLEQRLAEVIEGLSTGLPDQQTFLRAYDPLGLVGALPSGLESAGLDPAAADAAFASKDQRFRVLYVKTPEGEEMDYKQADHWLGEIRAFVQQWKEQVAKEHPDWAAVELGYTGEPAFVAEIGKGMEEDMHASISSTIMLICLLFWIMHRRLVPLLWLVFMLIVTFGLTLSIASLVIGQLSIMSVGFAAILIGLTIDYGVILYKEARLTPGDPVALKRLVGPSIIWAATTTAAVFFALQFSSFPGVAQLGVLVAIGVLVGSVVMLLFYSPVAARYASRQISAGAPVEGDFEERQRGGDIVGQAAPVWSSILTGLLPVVCIVILLTFGWPRFQQDFKPMQLRDSPSMNATEQMQARLSQDGGQQQPVVIAAESLAALPGQMQQAEQLLKVAVERGGIANFILPQGLVPNVGYQKKNRKLLAALLADEKRLRAGLEAAGFNDEAWLFAGKVFAVWQSWLDGADAENGGGVFPGNANSRWVMERLFSRDEQGKCYVLGAVNSKEGQVVGEKDSAALLQANIYITGWHTLDPAIQRLIERDSLRVFLPVALALFAMLYFIFRNWRDVLLSLGTLIFSIVVLLAISSVLKIEWNAFSLSSVPILFGVGLDYTIHMIFALRRSEGDLRAVRLGISRAILFCGLSTAIGFGSLSLASNLGLASIGRICGLGVLIIMLTTVGLLPYWWLRSRRQVRG
ncbi:MAG: MMPL family transporter [Verrucomicrobiota bacterium]